MWNTVTKNFQRGHLCAKQRGTIGLPISNVHELDIDNVSLGTEQFGLLGNIHIYDRISSLRWVDTQKGRGKYTNYVV